MHEHENEGRIQLGSEVELRSEMELKTPHADAESDKEEEAPSTERQVQEALQNLPSTCDMQVQLRPCDKTERCDGGSVCFSWMWVQPEVLVSVFPQLCP